MKKQKFTPDVEKLISAGFSPATAVRYDSLEKSCRTDMAIINAILSGDKPYSPQAVKSVLDCFSRLSSSLTEIRRLDVENFLSSVRNRISHDGIEL